MNFRIVFHQFGLLLAVLGGLMLLLSGGGFGVLTWLHEDYDLHVRNGLMMAAVVGVIVGGLSWLLTRKGSPHLGRREALLLTTSLSWLLGAALAALPLLHWARSNPQVEPTHPFRSFWACYFEAMSGLTTTGATVLANVEALPNSLLLWRSMLHWVGGLGILVLFVAVLPTLGAGGKRILQSEATSGLGRGGMGVRPQIRDAARIVWLIYAGLTGTLIAALTLAGMPLFDAVCHGLGVVATGGFSSRNAGLAAFDSLPIDIIIIAFVCVSGVNFAVYDRLLRGQWRTVLGDRELRLYAILLLAGTVAISATLFVRDEPIRLVGGGAHELDAGAAVQHGALAASGALTTIGVATADFDVWPLFAKAVLLTLMLVGGCAGSTASGLKVIRFWIVFKVLHREFERMFRPQIVRPIRVAGGGSGGDGGSRGGQGGAALDDRVQLATLAYVLAYLMILALGAVTITLCEHAGDGAGCSFTTAATASLATVSNVGVGFEMVGPGHSYDWFSTPSLVVMSVLMALGRLEIFAIVVLFMPRFWRGTS